MRRLALALLASTVLSGTALAADIARRAPVVAAPTMAVVNWSGVYIGAHLGWAGQDGGGDYWDGAQWWRSDDGGDSFIGGGQIGFNYQVGQWVLGVEGDISWADLGGGSNGLANYYGRETEWIATLTGRVGYAWDAWLFYVKGGAAWADGDDWYSNNLAWGNDDTRTGWTLGVGLEWAWTPNWSAKIEYNYLDFGDNDDDWIAGWHRDDQIHAVKIGINYRFGGPTAVSSRY